MQIGILLIAGAVETNFVSYDAKMLGKYGSRKLLLCGFTDHGFTDHVLKGHENAFHSF